MTGVRVAPDASRAWSSAEALKGFLQSSRRARRCSLDELYLGDLVQMTNAAGTAHHTVIVTALVPGPLKRSIPAVTYHSRYRVNVPLTVLGDNDDIWNDAFVGAYPVHELRHDWDSWVRFAVKVERNTHHLPDRPNELIYWKILDQFPGDETDAYDGARTDDDPDFAKPPSR
jgi:hypothetical protein